MSIRDRPVRWVGADETTSWLIRLTTVTGISHETVSCEG
jgi:hypothetical protein